MMETTDVRVRDCACPGTPHEEGDRVYLLVKPSLACGLAAQGDAMVAIGDKNILAQRWIVTYVRHGAIGWNFLDAAGQPVPFDVEVLLADYALSAPVAEKADELYSDTVFDPLVERLNGQSRNGRTAASTSPRRQSIRKPRGRSSRATSAATKRSSA